jgi:hypothetical protein
MEQLPAVTKNASLHLQCQAVNLLFYYCNVGDKERTLILTAPFVAYSV